MRDERRVMNAGLSAAVLLIIVRILLEQAGASVLVASIFGVVWLYFILPAVFAIAIRNGAKARPFGRLMIDVVLFAVYTRIMVAATYVLAHYCDWSAARFSAAQGGTVGPGMQSLQQLLYIVLRNAISWIVMAAIIGAIVGSVTLLIKRSK